jgi:hypothetical protein
MPEFANIHKDVFLTSLSVAYTNEDYVAEMVFPIVPVDKRTDLYVIYNKDVFLRGSGKNPQGKPNSTRRPNTRSTEITWDVSNQPFVCQQLARSYPLGDAEVNYADAPLELGIDATMSLTETILIDNELAVAGKAMLRSNYASSNKAQLTASSGNGTSWASNSMPFSTTQYSYPLSKDIPNGKKAVIASMIRAATHMALNYNAAQTLAQNWEYVGKFFGVSTEGQTRAGLVPVIGGLQVVECNAQYATSAENATPVTTGFIWQDDQGQDAVLIYYRPKAVVSKRTVALGVTFEAEDDTLGGRGIQIKRWREEWRDAELIEARTTRDWRFVATDGSTNGDNANGYASGGYLLSGVTL